jgi:hypothetical protein
MFGLLDCFLLKCQFTVQSLYKVNLITESVLNFKAFLSFNLDFAIDQIDTFDALIICFLKHLDSADKFGECATALSWVKSVYKFFFDHGSKIISYLAFVTDTLDFTSHVHLHVVKSRLHLSF